MDTDTKIIFLFEYNFKTELNSKSLDLQRKAIRAKAMKKTEKCDVGEDDTKKMRREKTHTLTHTHKIVSY